MPILWSEEYLTDVRIIPILTQRDIGVDRTLALLIWLIENVLNTASFRHNAKKPHQYKPHKQTSDK